MQKQYMSPFCTVISNFKSKAVIIMNSPEHFLCIIGNFLSGCEHFWTKASIYKRTRTFLVKKRQFSSRHEHSLV